MKKRFQYQSEDATTRTRDAVKYGRVSSKEQEKEGFSIPAQWKLLDQYAKAEGVRVVREFVDVETAKKPGRTGFASRRSADAENAGDPGQHHKMINPGRSG